MLSLWLPILVTTIALFFASFLSWMVLQLHARDWVKFTAEDELIDKLRSLNIPVGNYMFPGADSNQQMNSPEYQEKYQRGPRGIMTILPAANMTLNLALTFLYFGVCCATFAYLASFALNDPELEPLTIFRFVATVALLTFLAAAVQHAIWFRNRITGHVVESIAYALIAGTVFTLLWPGV